MQMTPHSLAPPWRLSVAGRGTTGIIPYCSAKNNVCFRGCWWLDDIFFVPLNNQSLNSSDTWIYHYLLACISLWNLEIGTTKAIVKCLFFSWKSHVFINQKEKTLKNLLPLFLWLLSRHPFSVRIRGKSSSPTSPRQLNYSSFASFCPDIFLNNSSIAWTIILKFGSKS